MEFSGRLPWLHWLGSYDPVSRDLVINSFRLPETYGKEFYPPELESVSAAGKSLAMADPGQIHQVLLNLAQRRCSAVYTMKLATTC
jgi:hypothetical protein